MKHRNHSESKAQAAPAGRTVALKNRETGKVRTFGLRYWSWEGFFSVIGLSQFLMGDYVRGLFHLFMISGLTVYSLQGAGWQEAAPFGGFLLLLMIAQGVGYNRFTVVKLLRQGWVFDKPHSPEARAARKEWKLEENAGA